MMIYWGIIGIHIYIDIDMTVIELRHNSYIGQKKEFWRCARRGMPQLVPTGAGLHNHPQLWKPWPSSMIGVSHWNSQFVDDLPIEYWCSTWCSSAALSERKKVGTIPEFNLIPRPVANCTSAVRRIAGNFVGSVKATGTHWSRCTSLTRQEICQICPISGLNRWRPCWEMQKEPSSAWGYPELCSMRISIDIYRILWTMVFFPWLCEPKSKCCPFHVSTLASSHHGSPGVVPCSSARWRRRRAAGHLNLHTIVKAPENEIAKLVPMTISLWYTHIDR